MASVLLMGDFPTVGLNRENFAIRVSADKSGHGPSGALALVEQVEPLLSNGKPVLIVYPSWQRETVLPLLRMVKGLLSGARIGLVPLNLPPLALSFVADQLAMLSEHIPPGEVAAIAPRLSRAVASGAWLSSVARFEHADTGLRAHFRSYLPGTGFMVTLTPGTVVHRITAAVPISPWPGRLADPVMLLVSGAQGDLEWANTKLGPSLASQSVREVPAQPLSAGYWGTAKFTEFVAWSGHAQTFPFLHGLLRCQNCRWCGERTDLPECCFCGMAQPHVPAPESALPDLWLPWPAYQPPAPPPDPQPLFAVPAAQPVVMRPEPMKGQPANGQIVQGQLMTPPAEPAAQARQPPVGRQGSTPPSFGAAMTQPNRLPVAAPVPAEADEENLPPQHADAYQWYPDQARPRG